MDYPPIPQFRLYFLLRSKTYLKLPLSQWSNCCRSRKCIRGHIPMHEFFFAVFIYFSYLFYLGRPSLLGLQTKTRRKQLFSFPLVQALLPGDVHELHGEHFCACAICKRSKKCLAQKVARFGSLGPISMIHLPFNSSCVTLQYEPGTKFSIEQFQLHW